MVRHLLCVSLVLAGVAAWADGGFVPARVTVTRREAASAAAQKAVIVSEPGSEVLLLETTYRGPSAGFAWVIPVPEAPQEVFPANAEFMDAILRQTSPFQVDHYVRERSQGGRGGGFGAEGGASSSTPAPVRVLARMIVGEYDAAVLAADQAAGGEAGDIVHWLQDNDYEVLDALTAVLQPYTEKRWVFVALKLQQGVAEEKPLLQDVAPVGIRFPQRGRRLVFPLHVSRLSAPPFTAIALVTISTYSYTCRELPVVRVEQESEIRAGETYGHFRRKMSREPVSALLCESCVGGRFLPALTMSYRAGGDVAVKAGLGGYPTVTRYFAYLQPEEMEDLNLAPHGGASGGGYAVLVERTGRRRLGVNGVALQKAVDAFTADSGALPCKPQDLIEQPLMGQDTSGNAVPVRGWQGPYLRVDGHEHPAFRPADLRGWLLDPLSITFWDRDDLSGTIRPATLAECQAAGRD